MAAADDFATLITARLTGRPVSPDPDAAATPPTPTPRLPAPNMAQGSSVNASPPPIDPADVFVGMLHGLGAPTGDHGWRQIR